MAGVPPGASIRPRRAFRRSLAAPFVRFWDWMCARGNQGFDPTYYEAIEKAKGTQPGTSKAADDGKTSEAIFYDAVMQQVDWQIRGGDSTDQKIAATFILVTAVLPIGAALIQANVAVNHDPLPRGSIVCAVGTVLSWLFAVLSLFSAYGPNQWEVGPRLPDFFRDARKNDARILLDAEAFYVAFVSIPKNEKQLRHKARRFNIAVGLFVVEVSFVIAAVVVYLLR